MKEYTIDDLALEYYVLNNSLFENIKREELANICKSLLYRVVDQENRLRKLEAKDE